MTAGNGASERLTYEPQSPATQARMCSILWAESPGMYAWLVGYALTGRPPSQVRKRRAPDLHEPEPLEQRSTVGGR